jgi:hypothetical protein
MRRKMMNKKYYVQSSRGSDFVIELPEEFEVTFSTVNPAGQRADYALRVYEKIGQKKFQRAVFSNVTGFRDLSIPLMRKVEQQVGNSAWSKDSEGNFSETVEVKKNYELANPDDGLFDEEDDE